MFTSAHVQGEGGKPGERGVMGAIGAPVSSYCFCFPHHSQACLVHSVEVCCLFYCFFVFNYRALPVRMVMLVPLVLLDLL